MEDYEGPQRRTGADRRRAAERRNGLAVLMAGCSDCDRIAPSPAVMHSEGWVIVADDLGLVRITCPDHNDEPRGTDPDALPDYCDDPADLSDRGERRDSVGRPPSLL